MANSQQVDEYTSPHWVADNLIRDERVDHGTIQISAKALNIKWGNDKRFWKWIKLPKEESIFEIGAELIQVNWIQVTRELDLFKLVALKTYEIYYVVKFKVDAFGWHSAKIKFKVKANGEEDERSEILESYKNRHNVWHEIYGGKFTVPADGTGTVEFGMYEVATAWWKGSMVLEGVKLKPK
ncbi:hypothetical protein HHK36_000683 [Tetracentron sinense]|uniref:Uncharacterized protein n=1 Tax=Tetracentron sinense TaxID=13715 RepID=A0A835DU22_TETSI|nr:hypothetical protein HHK36_000683 [Tetracentron sinense]